MPAQKVLITAGASGIGRAIAAAFQAQGAAVFVADINTAALATLRRDHPGIATTPCDMANRADIERMVPEAAAALGGLDVLVNNAGIAGPTLPVEAFDPAAWEQVMQVNLTGTFNTTRLAIPYLRRSTSGSIIVMSSVAGRFGYPNRSAYATSKWGLIGFTKTLSRELGDFGIRVNAILPGAVEGARVEAVFAGRAQQSGRTIDEERADGMRIQSIKRFVDPADIAAMVLFLTSDAGKSISGQALPIDNDMQNAS